MVTCKVDLCDPALIISTRPSLWRVSAWAKLHLEGAAHQQMLTAGSTKWERILITGVKRSASQLQSVVRC